MLNSELELKKRLRKNITICDVCHGWGFLDDNGTAVKCSCLKNALYNFRLYKANLPPALREKSLVDFEKKESTAYLAVMDYINKSKEHLENGQGLYIYGYEQSGKSLLACSLLKELMLREYECRYIRFSELIDDSFKDKFSGLSRTMDELDFICIDEVGRVLNGLTKFKNGVLTGSMTHGAVEFLMSILSKRADFGKPIILTGSVPISRLNMTFPSLANYLLQYSMEVYCEPAKQKSSLTMENETNN